MSMAERERRNHYGKKDHNVKRMLKDKHGAKEARKEMSKCRDR